MTNPARPGRFDKLRDTRVRSATAGDTPAGETPAARKADGRKRAGAEKVRATFHLPADLLDELRGAVVQLSGPPLRLTLAAAAEDALRAYLERLRTEHHRGRPFDPPAEPLRGGRPIGS